jgi:hypothetical protein
MADGVLVYRRQLILPTTFTVTVAFSAIRLDLLFNGCVYADSESYTFNITSGSVRFAAMVTFRQLSIKIGLVVNCLFHYYLCHKTPFRYVHLTQLRLLEQEWMLMG